MDINCSTELITLSLSKKGLKGFFGSPIISVTEYSTEHSSNLDFVKEYSIKVKGDLGIEELESNERDRGIGISIPE